MELVLKYLTRQVLEVFQIGGWNLSSTQLVATSGNILLNGGGGSITKNIGGGLSLGEIIEQ